VKGMTTPDKQPLTLTQAEYTLALAVGLKPSSPADAETLLKQRNLLTAGTLNLIADNQKLTNGDTYMLLKDLADGLNR
ncbi:MAG: hypothetical protein K0R75_4085, partial [Paenibacillaceae bacterium]|nr:hypothetical protein [Paenibacillaceae bacterium]